RADRGRARHPRRQRRARSGAGALQGSTHRGGGPTVMNTGPRPLTKQRSPWEPFDGPIAVIDGIAVDCVRWRRRRVSDGGLIACVSDEPSGWHMSISFRNQRGEHSRYPTWDEIAHARYELLPHD